MKKFLAIAVIAATLTSCGGGETKEEAPVDSTTVAPVETPAPTTDSMATPATDSTAKVTVDSTKKP